MPSERPFRFGVLGENARSADTLVTTARRAEQAGYSTFLLRDHFLREPFGEQLAPMVALAAVASATEGLRLGTLVLANDYRHPVMLAKEAATLDALSGGRFELGLGAGWLRTEYDRAGMSFDAPGVRVDRLAESLQLVKDLLTGESVTHDGEHYSVASLTTYPPARQRPRPPILVGAGSERMLRMAGREADIVGVLPRALPEGTISDAVAERMPEMLARKVDWVRRGAGARFADVELSMMISPQITDDVTEAATRLAADHGWSGLPTQTVLALPSTFLGPTKRIAEVMQARRARYGFSYYVVSDAILDDFAPIVESLAGT